MILHQTINQYQIYLKALGLPAKRFACYQRVLADVESFYGPETPLEAFNNSLVLEYVKENDPFETDPLKVERGAVFCKFTHWLMKNHLIPAWAKEMRIIESDHSLE
ncbi:MAG: hypothetical protein IH586_02410 [Anaerolineaceae bacterium]|nr:hypothetical protein [Anaerolineaceae bacterium]